MVFIRSILFNILFYGATLLMSIIGLPILLLPVRYLQRYQHLWTTVLVFLLHHIVGIRHHITGPKPEGQVIYAAKHQSAWETIVLYREFGSPAPVLKRELIFLPLIGLYFLRVPSVPINRSAGRDALRQLISSARKIAETGSSILIFPQGTRVAPGASHPYHAGTFAIYQATGLPVVPVALNAGLVWPRQALIKKPGLIDVQYLEPIPPGLDRKSFMEKLETSIETATHNLSGMPDQEAAKSR
ncbi:MAG: 1-acyl-sn-glycerol-3-phosphate acyltransferase [Alphaproteobacteria bacterium]|nr:1-acyl-sn-glycerol-3-phosphate acyltransferase [Alphaproteobacteria bacterium]